MSATKKHPAQKSGKTTDDLKARLARKDKRLASGRKKTLAAARQDLPDPAVIIGEEEFTSPKGNKYQIILTNEMDAYERENGDPQES